MDYGPSNNIFPNLGSRLKSIFSKGLPKNLHWNKNKGLLSNNKSSNSYLQKNTSIKPPPPNKFEILECYPSNENDQETSENEVTILNLTKEHDKTSIKNPVTINEEKNTTIIKVLGPVNIKTKDTKINITINEKKSAVADFILQILKMIKRK